MTRQKFRELIDPVLDELGLRAEDVKWLRFDFDGFEVCVFERDETGSRVPGKKGLVVFSVLEHPDPETADL